VLLVWFEER